MHYPRRRVNSGDYSRRVNICDGAIWHVFRLVIFALKSLFIYIYINIYLLLIYLIKCITIIVF